MLPLDSRVSDPSGASSGQQPRAGHNLLHSGLVKAFGHRRVLSPSDTTCRIVGRVGLRLEPQSRPRELTLLHSDPFDRVVLVIPTLEGNGRTQLELVSHLLELVRNNWI